MPVVKTPVKRYAKNVFLASTMDGTMQLISPFALIPDPRRLQGRCYSLGYLLLFTLLAILSGATSYRSMARFIEARREQFNGLCGLRWKRAPAYHSLRYALHGLEAAKVKTALRDQAAIRASAAPGGVWIALDSPLLRRDLEHFQDCQARRVLNALATPNPLLLGQVLFTATDPMPSRAAVQQLIEAWGLSGKLFLLEALPTPESRGAPLTDS